MSIKDDMEDVQEAVINELISDNGLNPLTVGDLQITTAKIADDAVTASKIGAGEVGTLALADNSVTTAKIADNNVTPAKLSQAYLPLTGGSVSGNVGIGTSAPLRQLHISNTSGNSEIAFTANPTNGVSSILFGDGLTGTPVYRGYLQYNHQDDALLLATAAQPRMRINSQGHVILSNIPTSASGLSTGSIYSDGGTLKIV